jgi:starch synthase
LQRAIAWVEQRQPGIRATDVCGEDHFVAFDAHGPGVAKSSILAAVGKKRSPLRVLFAASECAPWIKTGGLGDICAALPRALRSVGIDARVLLPGYPPVLAGLSAMRCVARLAEHGPFPAARLMRGRAAHDVPVFAIECAPLYERSGGPYQDDAHQDWPDNGLRFGMLSRVAALLGRRNSPLPWQPDVVHGNDWQTGLTPAYLRFSEDVGCATLMTIHNLAFQGIFPPALAGMLGLPPESFAMHGVEYYGNFSFLKAGLYYADAISTVSPTYAREIQSAPLGFGMQGLLADRRASLEGILNGIDAELWNPATDPHLEANYDRRTLERKQANKAALQRHLGLVPDAEVPLLAVISRLTYQKGTDLLLEIAPRLLAVPVQIALLGTGDPPLEGSLRDLAARHPGRAAVRIGFDEPLAHLMEAGADAFLMPSRFEPCGMNQMYSQRYGTPPVVHATGGLIDSVVDTTPLTLADGSAAGFLFGDASAAGLLAAVERMLAVHRDRSLWRRIQRNGMARDFGWQVAAQRYALLYERLAASRRISLATDQVSLPG